MPIPRLMQPALLIGLLMVSGCSSYQESFDCPVGVGVRCASLSTINTKMDRGEIDTKEPGSEGSGAPARVYLSPRFRDQLRGPKDQ